MVSLGIMGVIAGAFGRLTRTEWVWWLAPLTVALDGNLPFRAPLREIAALRWPRGLRISSEAADPMYVASSAVATGVVAWSAYAGNRLGVLLGAGFAILASALDRGDEPTAEEDDA